MGWKLEVVDSLALIAGPLEMEQNVLESARSSGDGRFCRQVREVHVRLLMLDVFLPCEHVRRKDSLVSLWKWQQRLQF
jgi:hypothetical protein